MLRYETQRLYYYYTIQPSGGFGGKLDSQQQHIFFLSILQKFGEPRPHSHVVRALLYNCVISKIVRTMYTGLEVQACFDKALIEDSRVINNMLANESEHVIIDYCGDADECGEIKPHMRKIVADWMLEVCEDQQCVSHVFHTAVNYMDRFLSAQTRNGNPLEKKHFQSLASGCLLLASKTVEVRVIYFY